MQKPTHINRKPLYAAVVGSVFAISASTVVVAADAVNPAAQQNPLILAAGCNPCNPCAAKNPCNPCNPCAAKNPCNPCNPCAAKNPCNPCNPCAGVLDRGGVCGREPYGKRMGG